MCLEKKKWGDLLKVDSTWGLKALGLLMPRLLLPPSPRAPWKWHLLPPARLWPPHPQALLVGRGPHGRHCFNGFRGGAWTRSSDGASPAPSPGAASQYLHQLAPLPHEGNLGREIHSPTSVHGSKFPWLEVDLGQGHCGNFCIVRVTSTPGSWLNVQHAWASSSSFC